jgi:DNA-binding transcriptional regulator YiaG
LGLYQGQVAYELGVDEATIYNWEGNRTEPAVRLIPRIIQFLGYCPYTPGLSTAECIKLIRQSLGLSQKKMARIVGVDASTLKRWEAGIRRPSDLYVEHLLGAVS